MNAKQKLHQARLNEWTSRFTEQKASGLTAKQWCAENQISIHAFNYWKHILKEEVVDQMLPDIVPIMLPTEPIASTSASLDRSNCTNRAIRSNSNTVKLKINDVFIELDETVSESFLQTLIKAVRYA